ncbi:hypothetical protein D3C72_1177270 [compost metagenome]
MPAARWHPAGAGAGGRAHRPFRLARIAPPARRPFSFAHARRAQHAIAPSDTARHPGLELRPARRARAPGAAGAERVQEPLPPRVGQRRGRLRRVRHLGRPGGQIPRQHRILPPVRVLPAARHHARLCRRAAVGGRGCGRRAAAPRAPLPGPGPTHRGRLGQHAAGQLERALRPPCRRPARRHRLGFRRGGRRGAGRVPDPGRANPVLPAVADGRIPRARRAGARAHGRAWAGRPGQRDAAACLAGAPAAAYAGHHRHHAALVPARLCAGHAYGRWQPPL